MKTLALVLVAMPVLLATGAADAASPGTPTIDPRQTQIAEDIDLGEIVLSEIEKRLIRSYYTDRYHAYVYQGGNKKKQIPPGIAKKGWLPPGIYKQLVAGQRVPGDVVLYPLPDDLRLRLPDRPGYEYRIVDNKVLLIRSATNLILDMLTVAAIGATD
jgi:hypothetical protein